MQNTRNGSNVIKKLCENIDPGRDRTCNLLLRRQTRYPLRHWTIVKREEIFYDLILNKTE